MFCISNSIPWNDVTVKSENRTWFFNQTSLKCTRFVNLSEVGHFFSFFVMKEV